MKTINLMKINSALILAASLMFPAASKAQESVLETSCTTIFFANAACSTPLLSGSKDVFGSYNWVIYASANGLKFSANAFIRDENGKTLYKTDVKSGTAINYQGIYTFGMTKRIRARIEKVNSFAVVKLSFYREPS